MVWIRSGGLFRVPFQTDDPLQRLRDTDKFFNQYHDTQMHKILKRLIIPATWCVPSFLLRWGHSIDLYYFRYSNAFASLMLSDEPYYLLGNKVQNINLPLGLVDNVPTSGKYQELSKWLLIKIHTHVRNRSYGWDMALWV
jgi:hypothetical protein